MRSITYVSDTGEKYLIDYIMIDGRPKSVHERRMPNTTVGELLRSPFKKTYGAFQAAVRGRNFTTGRVRHGKKMW